MGTHVDVVDTKITDKGTFVNVVDHATGKAFGWTAQSNLGYAKAGANFVYEAKVKPEQDTPIRCRSWCTSHRPSTALRRILSCIFTATPPTTRPIPPTTTSARIRPSEWI